MVCFGNHLSVEDDTPEVAQLLATYPEVMHAHLWSSAQVAVRAQGLAVAEAQAVAHSAGVTARVVDADNPPAMTLELISDCVTFWVRHGIVARVSIG